MRVITPVPDGAVPAQPPIAGLAARRRILSANRLDSRAMLTKEDRQHRTGRRPRGARFGSSCTNSNQNADVVYGYRYRVTEVDLALAADAWAPSTARDLVMSVMADQAGSDGLHRALLAVSEVVTNAVSHGSDESDRISLLVGRTDDLVTVRVILARPVPELPSIAILPEGWSIGGYGLGVLDAVADR
jgi:anti-sigma regulatory factor (Ser/Thr protein kinase)